MMTNTKINKNAKKNKIGDETKMIMSKLKKAREEKNLSQDALAKMCGWGSGRDDKNQGSRISNYEKGRREPSLSEISTMAASLGFTLDKLLFDKTYFASRWVEIPVLKMDELIKLDDNKINKTEHEMVITAVNDERKLVCVRVEGDAMESQDNISGSVCSGDIITFELVTNEIIEPKIKDLVVVIINGDAKIREYSKDGSEAFLRAYNPKYPHIKIDKDVHILGIATKKERPLK